MTRDIGDGGDDTNGEDSPGEDSHDFPISGGNPNHECTLLTSPGKGAKSSSSGKALVPKGPDTHGDTELQATGEAAASWAFTQLSTALGAAAQSGARSMEVGDLGEHPSRPVS